MKNVLVTGGKGQLACCLKDISNGLTDYKFIYVDYDELDITEKGEVNSFFKEQGILYCINCAAYTAVDKAENEKELAKSINCDGARNLAEACNQFGATFIQISTDFVFDGQQSVPYQESDKTNPISIYGITKLEGELETAKILREHFVIRTSWLYSEHGNNFLKTMLRLGTERDELNVVCDQIGSPTYAGDLAKVILKIITEKSNCFGTYHYSNEGVASWYDFSMAIFDLAEVNCKVVPIKTKDYPTPAKRPTYSVMDKSKIKEVLNIEIPYWRGSLKKLLNNQIAT